MTWQDKVFAFVNILFSLFLIPQLIDVFNGVKLNIFSCFLTAAGVFACAYCLWTMHSKWGAFWTAVNGLMWTVMGVMSI